MRKTLVTSRAIPLGKVGEDEVNKVLFPVYKWKELYGEGTFGVVHQLPESNDPYPCDADYVKLNGEFVEWIIRSSDLRTPGRGKCELRYTVNGTRVKSVVYDTIIQDALGANSLEPPDPWKPWIDDLEDLAAEIAATTTTAFNTLMAQITAQANTLSPGSPATASYDNATKKFTFGIPKGNPGSGGGGGGGDILIVTEDTPVADIIAGILDDKLPVYVKQDSGTYIGVYVCVGYGNDGMNDYVNFGRVVDGGEVEVYTATADDPVPMWNLNIYEIGVAKKIKIGTTKYTPTRKPLTITENGVTTTYYVCDIT